MPAFPPRSARRPFPAASRLVLSLLFASPLAATAQETPAPAGVLVLDPIVLTANRTPTPAREVGSAVSIIEREELESRQARVVSDVLRSVPGAAVNRTGTIGNLTQLRLRGSEGNHTLVLIDGIEVNDPAAGSEFDFAHLLAQDIERIEVLRGPQSALYGSDAIGGVVNIVSRRGDGSPKLGASIERGTRDTWIGHASVGGGGERFDYFASIGGLRTDGFSSAAEWRGNDERDGYRNGTAFTKLGFAPIDTLRFDLVGRYTDYRMRSDDFWGGVGAIDADSSSKGEQMFGRLQATLDLFGGGWQNIVGVARSEHDYDYFAGNAKTSSYEGTRTKADWQSTARLESEALLPATHRLTFGLEYEEDEAVLASQWSNFDRSYDQTGIVGEYQLGLFDDLFLAASVRHDWNDMFEDETTFRLTGAYHVAATGTKLRASYGTGIKNPTLFELYGYTDTYRGNPELEAERARGWDIGFDQKLWDERIVLDASYFSQRITDLITGSGETSINMPGTSEIDGIELGLTLTPIDNLVLRAAYTWLDAKDNDGADLVRRPNHAASLNVSYTFLADRANLNLGIVHNGEQKDWAFDEFFNRREVELDSYTLVNLAGSYRLLNNAELIARVENLLDEEYEEVFTYGGTGRMVFAGLRLTF